MKCGRFPDLTDEQYTRSGSIDIALYTNTGWKILTWLCIKWILNQFNFQEINIKENLRIRKKYFNKPDYLNMIILDFDIFQVI